MRLVIIKLYIVFHTAGFYSNHRIWNYGIMIWILTMNKVYIVFLIDTSRGVSVVLAGVGVVLAWCQRDVSVGQRVVCVVSLVFEE